MRRAAAVLVNSVREPVTAIDDRVMRCPRCLRRWCRLRGRNRWQWPCGSLYRELRSWPRWRSEGKVLVRQAVWVRVFRSEWTAKLAGLFSGQLPEFTTHGLRLFWQVAVVNAICRFLALGHHVSSLLIAGRVCDANSWVEGPDRWGFTLSSLLEHVCMLFTRSALQCISTVKQREVSRLDSEIAHFVDRCETLL